jgi:carbonic anhydrase/acetyltransferase-like protein (isoleucine patch superfamily)
MTCYKKPMSMILPYQKIQPTIAPEAFVAQGAVVIGDVHIGAQSSVWFGCVVRGDVNHIRIGERTNIQDGTIVHVTRKTHPTLIGSDVTVGHQVVLHGCTLEDKSFVGMGAMVMDGAVVSTHAMLAAGAMLTPGKRIPTGELWAGSPAKFFRAMTPEEIAYISESAKNYALLAGEYAVSGCP